MDLFDSDGPDSVGRKPTPLNVDAAVFTDAWPAEWTVPPEDLRPARGIVGVNEYGARVYGTTAPAREAVTMTVTWMDGHTETYPRIAAHWVADGVLYLAGGDLRADGSRRLIAAAPLHNVRTWSPV